MGRGREPWGALGSAGSGGSELGLIGLRACGLGAHLNSGRCADADNHECTPSPASPPATVETQTQVCDEYDIISPCMGTDPNFGLPEGCSRPWLSAKAAAR